MATDNKVVCHPEQRDDNINLTTRQTTFLPVMNDGSKVIFQMTY